MYWPYDPEHPVTKVCTRCGVERHLMEFYLRRKRGRREARCKECVRELRRLHHRADREASLAKMQAYRDTHRQELRAARRDYYAAHKPQELETMRRWRETHRERVAEMNRAYCRRYPRKTLVRHVTHLLRRIGFIARPRVCADCGGPATQHHHPDYAMPLWVVPLCRPCHMARHFAVWRREGGGPVRYPEEYEEDVTRDS